MSEKKTDAKKTGGAGAKPPAKKKSKFRTLTYTGSGFLDVTVQGRRQRVKPGDDVKMLRKEAEAELSRSRHLWITEDGGK